MSTGFFLKDIATLKTKIRAKEREINSVGIYSRAWHVLYNEIKEHKTELRKLREAFKKEFPADELF